MSLIRKLEVKELENSTQMEIVPGSHESHRPNSGHRMGTVIQSIEVFMNFVRREFGNPTVNGKAVSILGFPTVDFLYWLYLQLCSKTIIQVEVVFPQATNF